MALSSGERWGVAVAAVMLVILVAFILVMFVSGESREKFDECAYHLRMLHTEMMAASLNHKDWDKMPTGSAFWLSVGDWPGKRVRPLTPSVLRCPVKGSEEGVDYRGPSESIRTLKPDAVIGADRIGNHGTELGGNVLQKSGNIVEAGQKDDLWVKAFHGTKD